MKKPNLTPFDRKRIPPKQNIFLMPLIWAICKIMTVPYKLKITKTNMAGLKPPYLVLSNHQSFMDFYIAPLAVFPHRANYISELEGFENFGEWIYRQVGCLGTRKFVNDISLIKNIKRVIERKDIMFFYPEARYANVGTNSNLPESVGKLVKMLGVPVVTLNMKGNYLQSPIWNTTARKDVILRAEMTQIFTAEQVKNASVEQINSAVSEHLEYDEYRWQLEMKMPIKYPNRAKGLELVLYRCPKCTAEFSMRSDGAVLSCSCCNSAWEISEYGELLGEDFAEFSHIPDWYEWQRKTVEEEIDAGEYLLDTKVLVESLPNAKNFIPLGNGRFVHNENGISITFKDYGQDEDCTLNFPPISMFSIHTEYDYRKKGQCVTVSTLDNTYFLFPLEDGFNATKIQFAVEYLYEKSQTNTLKNIRKEPSKSKVEL